MYWSLLPGAGGQLSAPHCPQPQLHGREGPREVTERALYTHLGKEKKKTNQKAKQISLKLSFKIFIK